MKLRAPNQAARKMISRPSRSFKEHSNRITFALNVALSLEIFSADRKSSLKSNSDRAFLVVGKKNR